MVVSKAMHGDRKGINVLLVGARNVFQVKSYFPSLEYIPIPAPTPQV